MAERSNSIFYKTIKWLTQDNRFHICIHDTSGILHHLPVLALPIDNIIHSNPFCDCAKSTATGLKSCLKCKAFSIKKAIRQREIYIGTCYLGIVEMVKPVYFDNKLLCIMYLGNMLLENRKDETLKRIRRVCKRTGVDSEALQKLLVTLDFVTKHNLIEYQEIMDVLENCLMSLASDIRKLKANAIEKEQKKRRHWIIQSVENYISLYYSRKIYLSQLAQLYFINESYLCRLFKRETGESFSEYVNRVRLEKAKQLLTYTQDNITTISTQVGFNNVTYFNKLFKKFTGVTPGEFKRTAK